MASGDITKARDAAIQLWTTLDFSVGHRAGIRAPAGTIPSAMDFVLNDVRPIPNTRRSPSGLPLDFSATSAWHAACYLLVSYVFARVNKQAFSSDEHLFDTFFGNCPVYRGQP